MLTTFIIVLAWCLVPIPAAILIGKLLSRAQSGDRPAPGTSRDRTSDGVPAPPLGPPGRSGQEAAPGRSGQQSTRPAIDQ